MSNITKKVITKTTIASGVAAAATAGGVIYKTSGAFDGHGLPVDLTNGEIAKTVGIIAGVGAAGVLVSAGAIALGRFVKAKLAARREKKEAALVEEAIAS